MTTDMKDLREAAEANVAAGQASLNVDSLDVVELLDRLEAAERRAEDAEKERDEAVEEVRLLSAHCNGLDEQLAAVEEEAIDRAAVVAWSAVMDECKERGISPSSRAGSGWFKVIDAIRSLKKAGAETASKPARHGVDAEVSGGAGLAQVNGARRWNPLTDEDRQAAFESLPDMLEGFLKKWGWLHFAKEIERRCMEKNAGQEDGK